MFTSMFQGPRANRLINHKIAILIVFFCIMMKDYYICMFYLENNLR